MEPYLLDSIVGELSSSNVAKLAAGDDCFNGHAKLVVIFLELALHLREQRLIGKLELSPQGIAKQFTTELLDYVDSLKATKGT